MKTSGIYLYKDRETSANLYVGKSVCVESRHRQHVNGSKTIYASPFEKKAFQRGWSNLELIILESGVPRDQLSLREREWYLKMKPLWNTLFPKLLQEDLDLLCHKRLLSAVLMEIERRPQKLTGNLPPTIIQTTL
jgi:excinuclease UvrABC nuclease subunit